MADPTEIETEFVAVFSRLKTNIDEYNHARGQQQAHDAQCSDPECRTSANMDILMAEASGNLAKAGRDVDEVATRMRNARLELAAAKTTSTTTPTSSAQH